MGQEKALVIYGISQDKWLNEILPQHRALTYSDGEVLALEVTTHATGEWIQSVLESLSHLVGIPLQISRYKYFSQRCPIKELRSLLLTIPLTTIDLTPQFIKDALTTVHSSDLSEWIHNVFGQSALSKRRILFAQ